MDYEIKIYKGNVFIFGETMPNWTAENAVKEYDRVLRDKTLMGSALDDCDFIVLHAIDTDGDMTALRCSRM